MSGDGEDVEARFSHLLQPIRDLARNWDIDIATALEDYLEELDHLEISLDGGQTTLNFAQAALLIQGTACIYSRKVEYLHTLVFQVLDKLTTQQQGRGKKDAEGDEGSSGGRKKADDDDDDPFASGDAFLLLDDVVEEGKDIDLKKQQGDNRSRAAQGRARGAADEFCRPPLVAMEDHGSSFKVVTCTVHKSGALLMEGDMADLLEPRSKHQVVVDNSQRHSSDSQPQQQQQQPEQEAAADGGGGSPAVAAAAAMEQTTHDDDDDGGFDGGHGNDYDFGGGGDDSFDEPQDTGEQAPAAATPVAPASAPLATPMSLATANKPGVRELRPRKDVAEAVLEEEEDPWVLLDPHDPGSAPPRPFKKGRVPRPPTAKSQGAAGKDSFTSRGALTLSSALTFPEFAPLQKAHQAKARAAAARSRSGARSQMAAVCAATTVHPAMAQEEAERVAREEQLMDGDGDHHDAYDDDDGACDGYDNGGWGDGGGDDDEDDDNMMTYDEPLVLHGSLQRDASTAPMSLEDAFTSAPRSYEELCRAHMDSFMRGLEAYAHETQLTRRVADWQERVEPLLDMQERRGPFDIHCYGDEIIGCLDGSSDNHKTLNVSDDNDVHKGSAHNLRFQDIVQGKEKYEICRLFLASLQLANYGNVQLMHEAGPRDAEGYKFSLQLLSAHRHHEKFGTVDDHGASFVEGH